MWMYRHKESSALAAPEDSKEKENTTEQYPKPLVLNQFPSAQCSVPCVDSTESHCWKLQVYCPMPRLTPHAKFSLWLHPEQGGAHRSGQLQGGTKLTSPKAFLGMSQTSAALAARVPMNPGSTDLASARPCYWGICHRSLGMWDRPVLTCQRPFFFSAEGRAWAFLRSVPASFCPVWKSPFQQSF